MSEPATGVHRVVLDTNVVVDVLRGNPRAAAVLRERIERGQVLRMSVLTRYELGAGARPSELDSLAEHLTLYDDIDVDTSVADRAAEFARTFRRSHAAIDAIDYLIAATAELHADELLTLNVKHFPMLPGLRAPYRATF